MFTTRFLGVDRRVVLYRPSLQVPPPRPTRLELIRLLTHLGFGHIDKPTYEFARDLLGKPYALDATMTDVPSKFTCTTLVKHVYALRGIWIPRFVEELYSYGRPIERPRGGDLVFRSSSDGAEEPFHVGIVTNVRTVIHAAGRGERPGVTETPLTTFRRANRYIGARRFVPDWDEVETFHVPPPFERIESSDGLNIFVQRLLKKQLEERKMAEKS